MTLAARGEGQALSGYLGGWVAGGEWPLEMREISFGPVGAIVEGAKTPGQ